MAFRATDFEVLKEGFFPTNELISDLNSLLVRIDFTSSKESSLFISGTNPLGGGERRASGLLEI